MSDTVSFKYAGEKDDYIDWKHYLEKQGVTVQEKISTIINQELTLFKGIHEKDLKTASRHQDELRDKLLNENHKDTILKQYYPIKISDTEFIQAAKHDLKSRVENAVYEAVWTYWVTKWAGLQGFEPSQAVTKYSMNEGAKMLSDHIRNAIQVDLTVDIPEISLSDLRETDLSTVISFQCVIIGPSPKKLDTQTGKYIQNVLIQEPESRAKNNNPVVIKCILHGDDTNNIGLGQNKKIIGFYQAQEPVSGQKVTSEKSLVIDAIMVADVAEKQEITLTPHEIQIAHEFASTKPAQYLDHLIDSFCPKIFGRRLEKLALYLSLLGGSNFVGYRKESHMMLISEADTGKSELLKFTNMIAEKASIIDGSNSTGVGVLFALDEYDGIKILRAGAMILNSGGHLIVDEHDKMPKSEQKKLNIAMEQQRATYNKGGHVGNAETKTTVISACNPSNEIWNEHAPIIDNVPFDGSTLTRFDIVIRLRHETQENQIRAKMQHIARQKRGDLEPAADPKWLRGLLNHLRKLRPIFTPEAEEMLINKFVEFSQVEQPDGALPIQTRQMEGIQRIAEAYAKLLFCKEIDELIVQRALNFYKECLESLGMNTSNGIHQVDLRGRSINRDEFFEETFRNLALEDDDGDVVEYELAEKLLENQKFFKTDRSISSYIDSRKKSGWLYEPKVGKLRRQK